jgi:hypothetical protein
VVYNIFIKDIYMKDIPAEAILFDILYGKRSCCISWRKRELPKVEFKNQDETTPVPNFISAMFIAISRERNFVRGLPEMHVKILY